MMNELLYIEAACGISGDMFVGALLDLGADKTCLCNALESLPLDGYHVQISRVKKSGIDACDFSVLLDESYENHDYDMEYLHGSTEVEDLCLEYIPAHSHTQRDLSEIKRVIKAASLTQGAYEYACRIFEILAEAEAQAHGISSSEVHFHEVGALDSIVDITAAAVCFDNLGIKDAVVCALAEGRGTVRCQHGILPIPVPAVVNIAKEYDIPLHIREVQGELVTPTGAAIAAALRTEKTLPESFTVRNIGYGAGKRTYATSGFLRVMVLEQTSVQSAGR